MLLPLCVVHRFPLNQPFPKFLFTLCVCEVHCLHASLYACSQPKLFRIRRELFHHRQIWKCMFYIYIYKFCSEIIIIIIIIILCTQKVINATWLGFVSFASCDDDFSFIWLHLSFHNLCRIPSLTLCKIKAYHVKKEWGRWVFVWLYKMNDIDVVTDTDAVESIAAPGTVVALAM